MLTCLVPVLFTFNIQGVLKLKKNNFGAKRLIALKEDFQQSSTYSRDQLTSSFGYLTCSYVETPPKIITRIKSR